MEAMHLDLPGNEKRVPEPEYLYFNVAELHEKLNVHIPDILLVETDEDGSRNKVVYIKGEAIKYTLRNVRFSKLLNYKGNLTRVNKFGC